MNSPGDWRNGFVAERPLRILQVSTFDIGGGAEKIAWNLHHAYSGHGLHAWMAVRQKFSNDPNILLVPNDDCRSQWARIWFAIGNVLSPLVGKVRGLGRLRSWLHWIGQPQRWLEVRRGYEDFDYPGTWRLLDLPVERPDIVHCHNLHGGYFDLRALPWLSRQVPVVLTLHDAWLFSGHCAHSFDCERWKTGCGDCQDLTICPAIRRDAAAYNWQRKRDIFTQIKLYVATPSQWLMQKVEQSILAPAVVEARVIPNGVDLSVFHPGDQQGARAILGIPQDARMLLFVGYATRSSPWRDYATLEAAVEWVAERLPEERIILVCLGEERKPERIGRAEVQFIGYQKDSATVARFYQATDIYLHPSKVDTFPNTVLEALACGVPVVATAVGGIPEQVKPLRIAECGMRNSDFNRYGLDEATGLLVPPGDAEAMAKDIITLLTDDALRMRLGRNAARDARQRFDLRQQVEEYLEWYEEILEAWHLS